MGPCIFTEQLHADRTIGPQQTGVKCFDSGVLLNWIDDNYTQGCSHLETDATC